MDRIAEEVKAALKPHFAKNLINKDEYKDIMRRAVPKVSNDWDRWLVRIVAGPNHPSSFQECPDNLCGHVPVFFILCLVFINTISYLSCLPIHCIQLQFARVLNCIIILLAFG